MTSKARLIGIAAAAAVLAAGGLAIGLVLGGSESPAGGSPGAKTSTFTLRGSISVSNDFAGSIGYDGSNCRGGRGYSDLTPGTAVTVANQTGQVLATGAIGTSRPEKTSVPNAVAGLPSEVVAACVLNFAVQNVPDGLDSYVLTVSHRGTRVVPTAEAHDGVKLFIR